MALVLGLAIWSHVSAVLLLPSLLALRLAGSHRSALGADLAKAAGLLILPSALFFSALYALGEIKDITGTAQVVSEVAQLLAPAMLPVLLMCNSTSWR